MKSDVVQGPAIRLSTATALTVLYTVFYIAPFYLSPTLRSTTLSDRNATPVIKARIGAVYQTCALCTVVTAYVLVFYGHASLREVLCQTGLYPVDPRDVARSMLLVCILFAGPLFETVIVERGWREWTWASFRETVYDSWIGYRNYVVGPGSEELVFRALAISLFLLAKDTGLHITFTTPLVFGFAHLHHIHEFIVQHQSPGESYISAALTPRILVPGLVRSVFQFCYTTLFGWIAAFIYLRTGNLWSCWLAHTFCNFMGLPRVWGKVGQNVGEEIERVAEGKRDGAGDDAGSGKENLQNVRDGLTIGARGQRLGTQWTVVYYALLVAGAYGFWTMRWSLTESERALAQF